jgi:hypothetical protein
MPSAYATLQYTHILLLVYWLGADLGVYLCAKYVERPDLSIEERRRFLALLAAIDMGPRTALVLMIPTGLLLVTLGGWLPLAPGAVAAACLASIGWLALVWHLYRSGALAPWLRRIDHALRHAVVALAGLAGVALLAQSIAGPRWLGVKLLAYAGAVLMGLMLRGVLAEWGRGFAELREPATAPAGNARIARAAAPSRRYAWALWGCVMLAAFMGVTKPF